MTAPLMTEAPSELEPLESEQRLIEAVDRAFSSRRARSFDRALQLVTTPAPRPVRESRGGGRCECGEQMIGPGSEQATVERRQHLLASVGTCERTETKTCPRCRRTLPADADYCAGSGCHYSFND